MSTDKDNERPGIDGTLTRRRVSECPLELTATERRLLKDPDWIDEDEADLVLAMRERRTTTSVTASRCATTHGFMAST